MPTICCTFLVKVNYNKCPVSIRTKGWDYRWKIKSVCVLICPHWRTDASLRILVNILVLTFCSSTDRLSNRFGKRMRTLFLLSIWRKDQKSSRHAPAANSLLTRQPFSVYTNVGDNVCFSFISAGRLDESPKKIAEKNQFEVFGYFRKSRFFSLSLWK